MASEAAAALERRTATYPALVASGKLDAAEAQTDIGAWQAIAADWQYIASTHVQGALAPQDTMPARIVALDTAIARFFAAMDRAGEKLRRPPAETLVFKERQQITSLLAMRYWAEHEREVRRDDKGILRLHPRDTAWINAQFRKQHTEQREKAGNTEIERIAA